MSQSPPNAKKPGYTPRVVQRRTLKSGISTVRPMDMNPLPPVGKASPTKTSRYTPRLVSKRTLKSGISTVRPLEKNPLAIANPIEDRRKWLMNGDTREYLNNILRDVKAVGSFLGKIVEEENFLQFLTNFLYQAPDGIKSSPKPQKSMPPLPSSPPPQKADSSSQNLFDVDVEIMAKWDDGAYYKAVIEKKTEKGFVVRYSDYAESKEIVIEEMRELKNQSPRKSISVRKAAKELDTKLNQGLAAGGPSNRLCVTSKDGIVQSGKVCAVAECGSFRMAGFPYCQAHQSALSCGVFDASKIMLPNFSKKESSFSPTQKTHYATMPVDMNKRAQESSKRQRVREEIHSTEVTYVKSITIVMTSYVRPLRAKVKKNPNFVDSNTLTNLLSNWETLASFHQAFLADLSVTDSIPKTFIKFSDYFKLYTHYLNSYDKCLTSLDELRSNKKFSAFMDDVGKTIRIQGTLDLMSYLIMPVQRVPRYVMLLRELKKNTPPDHPHYDELQEAIEKISAIAKGINESKRKAENLSILFRIFRKISGLKESKGLVLMQPHRIFIQEGLMVEARVGGLLTTLKETTRIFYLFNDILLWTTENNKYKGWLNLSACNISNGKEDDGFGDWIQVETSQVFLVIKSTKGKDQTEKWKNDLRTAIDQRKQAARKKMEKRSERMKQRAAIKNSTLKSGGGSTLTHSVIAAGLADLRQGIESRSSISKNGGENGDLLSRNLSISMMSSFDETDQSEVGPSPRGHCLASTSASSFSRSSLGFSPKSSSPRQVKRRTLRTTGSQMNRPMNKTPLSSRDSAVVDNASPELDEPLRQIPPPRAPPRKNSKPPQSL